MGFGGISIWQLLIVLAIILLLFGTKRLRNIGGDLGGALKGFKKAINEDDAKSADDKPKAEETQKLSREDADFAAQDKAAVDEDKKKQQ